MVWWRVRRRRTAQSIACSHAFPLCRIANPARDCNMSTPAEEGGGEKEDMVVAAKAAFKAGKEAEKRGAWAEALEHMDMAHRLFKDLLGERDRDTLNVAGRFGQMLAKLGRLPEALEHNQSHLAVCREVLGEMDEVSITAQIWVANTLRNMGRYSEALARYDDVHQKRCDLHGENHKDSIGSLTDVAGALRLVERYPEALSRLQLAVKRGEEALG